MGLTYYNIRRRVEDCGKELEVNELARELQRQFSEPGARVKWKDAYEMAYHELIIE